MDKITVTGHTSIDYIFNIENFPIENGSEKIQSINKYYGGGAANVSIGLSKLGNKVKLITPLGYDIYSTGYYQLLKSMDIDISESYIFKKEKLSRAFVFTNKNRSQITYFYWGVGSKLSDINLKKQDFVHISTADSNFNKRVSLNSNFVSFDPGQDLITYNKEDLEIILKNTDILFVNRYELKLLCSILHKKFKDIKKWIDPIIVTMDKFGSVLYTKNRVIHIPSIIKNVVDPTGAGDAYRSGFLTYYLKDYPLDICCKMGSIISSFVMESLGCQNNLPTLIQAEERYKLYFKEKL